MIQILNLIEKSVFHKLEIILAKISIPVCNKNNRKGFSKHRSCTFGLTKQRFADKSICECALNKKYPELFEELFRIGDIYCPFKFTSVYVIQNCICPPHKDSRNNGESMIISIGNYSGCNLIIEGQEYSAKYRPIIFDGHLLEHYNTSDLEGNKYSLIFFKIKN